MTDDDGKMVGILTEYVIGDDAMCMPCELNEIEGAMAQQAVPFGPDNELEAFALSFFWQRNYRMPNAGGHVTSMVSMRGIYRAPE